MSFLAAIVLVILLNRRADRAGGDAAVPQFHFTDVTAQVGISFVHHGPTLDPKLDNIAPLIGSSGAAVSVADVNNDGWPDLYFTNSRFLPPLLANSKLFSMMRVVFRCQKSMSER